MNRAASFPAILLMILVVLLECGFKRRVRHEPDGMRCDLHGIVLKSDSVPILYGCFFRPRMITYAEEEEFPYANEHRSGPVSPPGPSSPRLAATRYCPECRQAEWEIQSEWHRWYLREKESANR